MKSFEKWTWEEVELTFGVKRVQNMSILNDWLSANEPISNDYEKTTLLHNLDRLKIMVDNWNEDEIKFFFVSNIVSLVDFFKQGVYSSFSQRTISAKLLDIHNVEMALRGRVEFLVAAGMQNPRQPFFFLHEYKPTYKTTPSDPLGQLLISMLAAHNLNLKNRPLYGLYVVGKLWQFVVLNNNQYAVSNSYDATDEKSLFKIFSILKKCKFYIEKDILNEG
jgi:hypothetical protein